MIEASFERGSRTTAVSGVYQYDTGQRLRMHGLPSPEELLGEDELLAGGGVTVQAQFSRAGDSQTEMRLAQWDAKAGTWLADVPDPYLTQSEPVHMYVYVYHGENEDGVRAKTMYEGVFTPIGRPAPNHVATDEQIQTWTAMENEVELTCTAARAAVEGARIRTQEADSAGEQAKADAKQAREAHEAAEAAENAMRAAEAQWRRMTVRTSDTLPGEAGRVMLADGVLTLRIPRGADGARGEAGPDGPAEFKLEEKNGVLTITPLEGSA